MTHLAFGQSACCFKVVRVLKRGDSGMGFINEKTIWIKGSISQKIPDVKNLKIPCYWDCNRFLRYPGIFENFMKNYFIHLFHP